MKSQLGLQQREMSVEPLLISVMTSLDSAVETKVNGGKIRLDLGDGCFLFDSKL